MLLEPSEKGQALLEGLEKTFDCWLPAMATTTACRAAGPTEAFRDSVVEGWYPRKLGIRFIGPLLNSRGVRAWCPRRCRTTWRTWRN